MSRRSRETIGPNVVTPTMTGSNRRSAVERIAAFATTAQPEHLTNDSQRLFKRNILDSLGCAIGALPGQPFQALREQFTACYPKELNARITIYTKDQRVLVKEQLGYEGGLANPMSWDRTVEKFHWLSEPFADEDLRGRVIEAVQQLDARRISDLMDLLAQIRPTAVFPATHSGIQ